MLNEEVLCMFRRWLCLALALVVSMGAFSLAEEIALEDGAVTVDAPEDGLLVEELADDIEIALPEDLELSLPDADQGLLSGEPEGLEVVEAVNDGDQSDARLELSASKLLIGIGEKCTLLRATRIPEDSSDAVTWSSSKRSVAKVNKQTGKITGVKKGQATITARTESGLSASCVVTVRKAPDGVTVTPAELTLSVGDSYRLKGKLPSGTGSTLSYTSGKKKIATVDKRTGVVTAVAPGRTTITVKTFNGHKAACNLTVVEAPAEVFLPDKLTVYLKQKATVAATAVDANGVEVPATFTYSVQNGTGKVSVNTTTGRIKGTAEGTAFIYVTAHNGVSTHLVNGEPVQTFCIVKVVKAPEKVELAATDATIGVGDTIDLAPRVLAKDGSVIEGADYAVSSSDESVLGVSESGVVTGLKAGSGTVTVTTSNGVQASCSVTVIEKETNRVNYRLFAAYSYYDSLPFVKRNSESMATVFKKSDIDGQGYTTKVLGNPSKSGIQSGIASFFKEADDNDVSIVYLCSHGHNNKSSYSSYRLSLMGYDSHKNNSRYYLTAKEIFNSVQAIKGNVILILDSCYSGTFINDMKGRLDDEDGRIAVLAAASNTKATFYTNKAKSVDFFTFFLLQGLGYNEKEGWWTKNADADKGSYPGYFLADKKGNGDGAATLGEFYSFAANCIDVNIPTYMKKSWYWGETSKVQKTRFYAGNLKNLVIYRPE
ncbi:MAG: Ig-like domain-containing protein [Clostridia bacterium]|nr:Ig-like domain-containing protein [Clostridia bacterium]